MIKIGIESDNTTRIDVVRCVQLLNSICQAAEFSALPARQVDERTHAFVDYEQESRRLEKLVGAKLVDFVTYVTCRPYEDNYFFYSSGNDLVLSLANWEHYTNLPLENGLFFFIAAGLLDLIQSDLMHEDSTGCLSDFLWDKTGIDKCLKMGFVCPDCRTVLEVVIEKSPSQRPIYVDLIRILDVIANTSRWGRSVLEAIKNKELSDLSPEGFEDIVADYYRSLGAKVEQNVNIAGFQIDVMVSENTPSGEPLRSVVECKFYRDKVGNRLVNDFARIVATIKDAREADRGIVVAYSGFTQDAYLAAKHTNIRLVQYKDIADRTKKHQKAADKEPAPRPSAAVKMAPSKVEPLSRSVFVIMPFSSDLDDLFYYGIYGAVRQVGATCIRMDQVHFTGDILQEIYKHIKNARIVLAEVSQQNSNVYYELGFAHATDKPVILLTKDVSNSPFDISGFNHIVYTSIADLEQKLAARLKVLIGE